MKALILTATALALVGCTHSTTDTAKSTPAPAKETVAAVPVNKMCATMHEHPVDPKVTIVHEGKTIGFCCADCIPEFKKDPAKYMATLK